MKDEIVATPKIMNSPKIVASGQLLINFYLIANLLLVPAIRTSMVHCTHCIVYYRYVVHPVEKVLSN